MKTMPSRDELRRVMDYLNGGLYWKAGRSGAVVGDRVGCVNNKGYRIVELNGRRYKEHRLVWVWHYGCLDIGQQLDHRNRDKGDNRIENLRLATTGENMANRTRVVGKHGYTGVVWDGDRKKYRARITVDGREIKRGRFDTPEDAHDRYKELAREFFGEFCIF